VTIQIDFTQMGASICRVAAETGTQTTIFDLSALIKQLLIFIFLLSLESLTETLQMLTFHVPHPSCLSIMG